MCERLKAFWRLNMNYKKLHGFNHLFLLPRQFRRAQIEFFWKNVETFSIEDLFRKWMNSFSLKFLKETLFSKSNELSFIQSLIICVQCKLFRYVDFYPSDLTSGRKKKLNKSLRSNIVHRHKKNCLLIFILVWLNRISILKMLQPWSFIIICWVYHYLFI